MWPFLAILFLAAHVVAVAFPQAPPSDKTEEELDAAAALRENFNPANGIPEHNISCVGSHYDDLKLPIQNIGTAEEWDPNHRSMQELCAKPQYNGGLPGEHVGGWCNHNEVMFDNSDAAMINTQLANPRVLLGCRYRCFCNNRIPLENRNIQPKPSEHQRSLQVLKGARESWLTYVVHLDIQDDFTRPHDQNQGSIDDSDVDVVKIAHFPEVRHSESREQPHYDYVSEDEANKITCTGSLPSFVLPPPYSVLPPNSDFQTNQQLCATQLDGGLLGANAGGYCHRSNPSTATASQTIWFSDEMTPRLDWTLDGGLFFASMGIRLHCYLNCKCTHGETDKSPTANVWALVNGHELSLRDNGRIDLVQSSSSQPNSTQTGPGGGSSSSNGSGEEPDPKRIKMTILSAPGYRTNGSAASPNDTAPNNNNTGPSDPLGFVYGGGQDLLRPQAWPTSLLGPVPSAPPNATEIIRPGTAGSAIRQGSKQTSDLTVCGNRCSGVADCASGGGTDHACTCAYPNANDAKWLGLDPVMPVSVCLVLMNVAFGGAKVLGAASDLNGRDIEAEGQGRYLDGEGGEWLCRCNATFTHNRCCGSRDGMVWLGGDI